MRANAVVAVQRGESRNCGGHPDRGEMWMPGGRIGAAVVHRRCNRDSGRHLVVEQPAYALPQRRCESVISLIVFAAGMRIDAAGEVAFQMLENLCCLVEVSRDHEQ